MMESYPRNPEEGTIYRDEMGRIHFYNGEKWILHRTKSDDELFVDILRRFVTGKEARTAFGVKPYVQICGPGPHSHQESSILIDSEITTTPEEHEALTRLRNES